MKAAVSAIALATLGAAARAQEPRVVQGQVRTLADSAPVAGVAVFALGDPSRSGIITGATGRFRFVVPAAVDRLIASRLGFAPETVAVSRNDSPVEIHLAPAPLSLTPAVITADRAFASASSSVIRELDIALRPRETSQELLRLAPGLVIAQHAGGGKAEQLFLRGFDADHGTDVAVSVDGIPVNMVTHAHGQGYADLHWLMPEVVEAIDVRKGPFDVRDGDFATAGAVTFRTKDRIGAPSASVRGGTFDSRHAVALIPLGGDASRPGGYVAGSAHFSDGPFDAPQGYRRLNGFGRFTAPVLPGAEVVATASAFDSEWDASGQIPDRAVRAGELSRFGAIDATEGGKTSRYDIAVGLRPRAASAREWEAKAYATRYTFDLYSNFTFFLADSIDGDGIEQVDDRTMVGGFASYGRRTTTFGRPARWSIGAGTRGDFGDVALYHQRARARLAQRVGVTSRQTHLFDWARYELSLTPRLRADLGVRADAFRFDVRDELPAASGSDFPRPSGVKWRGIVSPKLNLAFDASSSTTLFANAGTGFHSNDGRDVVLAARSDKVLPRALSTELGARHTWRGGSAAVALWALDLESELVYVGDEGITDPSGRTRRVGADVEVRARVLRWLWADADVNLSRGRFRDEPRGANRIPLAPSVTSTAGLTVRDIARPSLAGLDGGVRVRHIGSRAAIEDNSVRARGYTVAELFGGWQLGPARAFFAVDNLFDVDWNEAQFATTSRLALEPREVTELHYTPGSPRAIQVGLEYRFR